MAEGEWRDLVQAFVGGHIDERVFHDRFFELWHESSTAGWSPPIPESIQALFCTVEAYCPDPELRTIGSPFEADVAELRADAKRALDCLVAEPKS